MSAYLYCFLYTKLLFFQLTFSFYCINIGLVKSIISSLSIKFFLCTVNALSRNQVQFIEYLLRYLVQIRCGECNVFHNCLLFNYLSDYYICSQVTLPSSLKISFLFPSNITSVCAVEPRII